MFTLSQVRNLLAIEEQQYRSWRKDFEVLAEKKGRHANFTLDEICILAIIKLLINEFSITKSAAVGFVNPIAEELRSTMAHIVSNETSILWLSLSPTRRGRIGGDPSELSSESHQILINLVSVYKEVLARLVSVSERPQGEMFVRPR